MSKKVGGAKPQRYVQPSLLMALKAGPSYGYQLIQTIGDYGFLSGDAPPGMIYRHLRQMDEEGLVVSSWDSEGRWPGQAGLFGHGRGTRGPGGVDSAHGKAGRDRLDGFIRRYRES